MKIGESAGPATATINSPSSPARCATFTACSACARITRASAMNILPALVSWTCRLVPWKRFPPNSSSNCPDLLTEVKSLRRLSEVQGIGDSYGIAEMAEFHSDPDAEHLNPAETYISQHR